MKPIIWKLLTKEAGFLQEGRGSPCAQTYVGASDTEEWPLFSRVSRYRGCSEG